jgi:hypothetical protein
VDPLMNNPLVGLAVLFVLGVGIYWAASRLSRRPSDAARVAAAGRDAAAALETGRLARTGHVMASWRTSPALGGLTSCCDRCGGICVVTAAGVRSQPPLTGPAGEPAPCPALIGGGAR